MKKISIFFWIFFFSILSWGQDSESAAKIKLPTCDYLKSTQGFLAQDVFEHTYNLKLCELQQDLDQEAADYILSIHSFEKKTAKDLIYDVGNVFCQGYFGKCDEKSLYSRYLMTCGEARDQALKAVPTTLIQIDTPLLLESYNSCASLAINKLRAFREAAIEEVAWNINNTIEASLKMYMDESHKKIDSFSTTFQTFLKKMGNIARSIEGFIGNVYK